MLGATEIIIILIVAGLIFFGGGNKIGEIARALGKFNAEFKKGKEKVEKELEDVKKEINKLT
jgi:TatA/E family protein of Tat protein translocase